MSASSHPDLKFAKGRPYVLDVDDRKAKQTAADRRGSEEASQRANGRCEIQVVGEPRCRKRDLHTHHMIGGTGRRGKGESAKAIRKQRACDEHHHEITHNILHRIGKPVPHFTDRYRRVHR